MSNNNRISNMINYLRSAMEFERFVYVWTNAMNSVNSEIRRIYADRKRLEETISSANNTLSTLDLRTNTALISKQKAADRLNKRAKAPLHFLLVVTILFLLSLCGLILTGTENILVLIAVVTVGVIFFFTVPVSLILHFALKTKANNATAEAKHLSGTNTKGRQLYLLQSQISSAQEELRSAYEKESVINEQQEIIHDNLQKASAQLSEIYAKNVLPPKYRNYTAIAAFYEYLTTNRCNTIEGHGGIYDTYETERIQLEQLRQQVMANERLEDIRQTNRLIYKEQQLANQHLTAIQGSLGRLEVTTKNIERNSEIAAVAASQSAATLRRMEWNGIQVY